MRTLRRIMGGWQGRQHVLLWHLRRYWNDRQRVVWLYRRGCREDAAVMLRDLREWWTPGQNRVITVMAVAGAVIVGVLIGLV